MGLELNLSTGVESVVETPPVPLPERQAALWEAAKLQRDAMLGAGFAVPGIGTFDSDMESRVNVNGAVTLAQVAPDFAMTWTLADNSLFDLDGAQMIAVGVAFASRIAAIHARAQQLRGEIIAAADGAALDAIDITTGWG